MAKLYDPTKELEEANDALKRANQIREAEAQRSLEEQKRAKLSLEESLEREPMLFEESYFTTQTSYEGLSPAQRKALSPLKKVQRFLNGEIKKDKVLEKTVLKTVTRKIPCIYVPGVGTISKELVCEGRSWEGAMETILKQGYSALNIEEYIQMLKFTKDNHNNFYKSIIGPNTRGHSEHVDARFNKVGFSFCMTYNHTLKGDQIVPEDKILLTAEREEWMEHPYTGLLWNKWRNSFYARSLRQSCPSLENEIRLTNTGDFHLIEDYNKETVRQAGVCYLDGTSEENSVAHFTMRDSGAITLGLGGNPTGHDQYYENRGLRLLQREKGERK
jgi:hypothetical protein